LDDFEARWRLRVLALGLLVVLSGVFGDAGQLLKGVVAREGDQGDPPGVVGGEIVATEELQVDGER
jgi:hypothetical protein